MARVNVTIPDDLMESARAAGLNVSRLAAVAVANELDRRARIAALDAYLAQLDAQLGPVPDDELQQAADWVDGLLAGRPTTTDTARRTSRAHSA